MNVNWSRFVEVISAAQNVILTSHVRPDCDSLGSCLGMKKILQSLGKQVRIVCGDGVPVNLAFIDPGNEVLQLGRDIAADQLQDADLLMILDTSAWIQLGAMADIVRNTTAKVIIFDHHEGEDDIQAELFKNTTAEAVGRMCVEAAQYLNVSLTPSISMPLFAALATDTGWFRFKSVTDKTFAAAGELYRGGACPPEIYGALFEQETVGRVRLRGTVLARIQTELDGRLAHTYILPDDYEKTGALPSDTEDLINLALEIEGTVFAVIFVGLKTGGYKVSFRSRCQTAANEIAKHFQGGGHRAAAGCTLTSNELSDVQQSVLSHVRLQLTEEFSHSVLQ